jgi:hypothetical protein
MGTARQGQYGCGPRNQTVLGSDGINDDHTTLLRYRLHKVS